MANVQDAILHSLKKKIKVYDRIKFYTEYICNLRVFAIKGSAGFLSSEIFLKFFWISDDIKSTAVRNAQFTTQKEHMFDKHAFFLYNKFNAGLIRAVFRMLLDLDLDLDLDF